MIDSRDRCAVVLVGAAAVLIAAAPPIVARSFEHTASQPSLSVLRVVRPPTLEDFTGMQVPADLDASLTRVEGFVQRNPEDGEPASQRTDVLLGYDQTNLYVVFLAFDAEPEKIRAHMNRRENVWGDETVEIQLDTFNDQRRAFSFLTNPLGVQWDAIWTEGEGFDDSWDTVWQSRGKLTEQGYVVLMSIPFKSLRFSPEERQTWRVVLVRDIPRNNETSFWPRVSSRIEGRLNQAATLEGLSGISPGRNMEIIPYSTARSFNATDADNARMDRDDFDADGGVDAKFVINGNLALDLTVNPDFSQVESDQPQTTVNRRFEVFFPEKRPFFLENAGYFDTPINLLFTRRIADPRAGARLTGKLGNYSIGGLLIDDEAPGAVADPGSPEQGERALFGAVSVSRDVGRQSNVGLLYVDRGFEDSSNRVGGLHGRFKLNENWTTRFQAALSSTRTLEDETLDDPAYYLQFHRSGRRVGSRITFKDIGSDFRAESGFVPRTDLREASQFTWYRWRPEGDKLVAFGPELWAKRSWDQSGTRLEETFNPGFVFQFRRQTGFGFWYWTGHENLRPADFDTLASNTEFTDSGRSFSFWSDFFESVQGNLNVWDKQTVNFVPADGRPPTAADEQGARVTVSLRPARRMRIQNRYLLTRLDDRATGERLFSNEIVRSQWSWQFTRQLSLRAILQYMRTDAEEALTSLEDDESFNGDLLLTYLVSPGTAFYIGYNGNYLNQELIEGGKRDTIIRTDELHRDSRQLFIKASYLFRL